MKYAEWHPLAAAHAYYEGWSIFDAEGTLRIMKVDDPQAWEDGADPSLMLNEFDSDGQAFRWVYRCAVAGSKMHKAALKMNGKLLMSRRRAP